MMKSIISYKQKEEEEEEEEGINIRSIWQHYYYALSQSVLVDDG